MDNQNFLETISLIKETKLAFATASNSQSNKDMIEEFNKYLEKYYISEYVSDMVKKSGYQESLLERVDQMISELLARQQDVYSRIAIVNEYNQTHEDKTAVEPQVVIEATKIRLQLDRLKEFRNELSKSIDVRNDEYFAYYNNVLGDRYNQCDKIFDMCFDALKEVPGYDALFKKDYSHSIPSGNIEEINFIYKYYHDKEFAAKINGILPFFKNVSKNASELRKCIKYVEYLRIAEDYSIELAEYIRLTSLSEQRTLDKKKESEEKLKGLSTNPIMGIMNRSERISLTKNIQKYDGDLEEIKEREPRIKELEEELTSVGLGDVINKFNVKGKGETVEEKVAIFIKLHLTKTSLDISAAEEQMLNKIKELKERQARFEEAAKKQIDIKKIDSEIKNYSYEALEFVESLKGYETNGLSPLLAANIIKLMCNMSRFDLKEHEKISGVTSDELVSVKNGIEEMMTTSPVKIDEKVSELLDVSKFEKLNTNGTRAVV